MTFTFMTGFSFTQNFKVSIFLVFTTTFIDILAGSLVIPILPEYSKYYKATTVEHGIIFSAYFLAQTLSIIDLI